jgi:hypothetical protein
MRDFACDFAQFSFARDSCTNFLHEAVKRLAHVFAVAADDGEAQAREVERVLMGDLRDGSLMLTVESIFESEDDPPLVFERAGVVDVDVELEDADEHGWSGGYVKQERAANSREAAIRQTHISK